MGSPDFAVPTLRTLVAAGHDVAVVYCQPPRAAGRGQRETPCAVHQAAIELGLPVRTPSRLRGNAAEHAAFRDFAVEAGVVAAYGLLLPPEMLAAPLHGCLNVHASLLPRWRGAAPIQAAILAGDRETGISIMRMDAGLDTGDVFTSEGIPIGPGDTAADLHDRLALLGACLLLRVLEERPAASAQPAEGVTYAPKLSKGDAVMNWHEDAAALERRVRAMHPWPGTYFRSGDEVIRVLGVERVEGNGAPGTVLDESPSVACGRGALRLLRLQRPGRAALDAPDFLRGYRMPPGTILS